MSEFKRGDKVQMQPVFWYVIEEWPQRLELGDAPTVSQCKYPTVSIHPDQVKLFGDKVINIRQIRRNGKE